MECKGLSSFQEITAIVVKGKEHILQNLMKCVNYYILV